MSETDDLIDTHVAADHAFGQARLERLLDDGAGGREIGFAARDEVFEGQSLRHAAALRVQHEDAPRFSWCSVDQFNFPNALTAISAVLLDDERPELSKPSRERGKEFRH